MKDKEKIAVYIRIVKGETICMCAARNKKCKRECPRDVVERDKYRGWQETAKRDRYGQ